MERSVIETVSDFMILSQPTVPRYRVIQTMSCFFFPVHFVSSIKILLPKITFIFVSLNRIRVLLTRVDIFLISTIHVFNYTCIYYGPYKYFDTLKADCLITCYFRYF